MQDKLKFCHQKWRKLGLGLKYCSATQQTFCKWPSVDVLRLCRFFIIIDFFLKYIFEHFERTSSFLLFLLDRASRRHFLELLPLLRASESFCRNLASGGGSSLSRPLSHIQNITILNPESVEGQQPLYSNMKYNHTLMGTTLDKVFR